MKPVRVFRHVEWEGPGYLAEVLARHGLEHEIVAVDADAPIPEAIDDVSGLVFMGGPMSVNDPLPWIEPELELIRRAAHSGLPVLGHCLGGQLIAKALGGTVRRNPVREIGWFPVERLDNAAAEAWFGALPERFAAFHWHGEAFSLPPGAKPLVKSDWCLHQGFEWGNMLALQFHVEMTPAMVREWAERFREDLERRSATIPRDDALSVNWRDAVQGPDRLCHDLERNIDALHQVADVVYDRWLERVWAAAPERAARS